MQADCALAAISWIDKHYQMSLHVGTGGSEVTIKVIIETCNHAPLQVDPMIYYSKINIVGKICLQ